MDIKRITAVAAFLAAGASAAGAGAQISMKGSDTLEPITKNVISGPNACTAANLAALINYIGTGSGNGETAIISATSGQYVAPMSRALGSSATVCTGHETTAQGIKFARDGIVVVADSAATETCGGTHPHRGFPTDPDFGTNANLGANWKNTLRILFTGLSNPAPDNSVQDCGSASRVALANAYSTAFETNCTATSCVQIRHLYRRGDDSGTTDTFLNLIGAPGVTRDATTNAVTKTPFCNGGYSTVDATLNQKKFWEATNSASVPDSTGLDKSDDDLIRRSCDPGPTSGVLIGATEQVCEFDGTLGLLLPIFVNSLPAAQIPAGETETSILYNGTNNPTSGVFRGTNKPLACGTGLCCNPDFPYFSATAPAGGAIVQGGVCGGSLLCANDTKWAFNTASFTGGTCASPAFQPSGTTAYHHGVVNGFRTFGGATAARNVPAGFANDPRAWNLWVRNPVNGTGNSSFRTDSRSALIQAAYFRIHTNTAGARNVGAAAPTAVCQSLDATEQIGCLSQASNKTTEGSGLVDSCSFGFAGRDSVTLPAAKGEPLALNGITGDEANILAGTYPFARDLFINSLVGFDNIPDVSAVQTASVDSFTASTTANNAQFNLAKCFADEGTTYAIHNAIRASGFIPLTAGPVCVNACGSSACTGGNGAPASSAVAW